MKMVNNNIRKIVVFGILLTSATFFYACMAGMANYGRNQVSNEAREKFESFQVLPDYNYYYIGSNVAPDALIAVHKSYTVASEGIWTKVDGAGKDIKYLVEAIQRRVLPSPYGYTILDPQGKEIGFYYSRWDPWPPQMEGENRVWVYPPDKKKSVRSNRND